MKTVLTRSRLLTGSALAAASFAVAPPAEAQCVVAANTVTCVTTTTTDTTNAGGTPASDRNYPVNTSAAAFTGTVSTGATVSGFGLAFTNTVGGTNALNVVNNGAVQVNAPNVPITGGDAAALMITAIGVTPVNYSGTGTITNLGPSGFGLRIDANGTGNITANVGGSISVVEPGTYGIWIIHSGTAGDISATTTTGTTIRAGYSGIVSDVSNAVSASTTTVVNNAAIGSQVAAPNTFSTGIHASSFGTGLVSVTNNGAIGAAGDRPDVAGIEALIINPASTAALSVLGSGAIFSAGTGIFAYNLGTGTTTVNYTGAINTASSALGAGETGVGVDATMGATAVTLGAVTAATDAVSVTSTGTQAITLNGVTTGTAGSGLVSATPGASTITVGTAGNVTGGLQSILLANTGGGSVTNNGIIGAAATGLAINAATATAPVTITNNAGAALNGRLILGTGADTVTNAGTINTQGTTDFGAGADTFANNGAGIFSLTASTVLAGLETFTNSGRINLNTFTLTGPAVAFTNTGTIDTNGSASLFGFTSLSNAGTIDLAAGTLTLPAVAFTNSGTILADEGASTITGQTSFANSGTLDLQDGAVGDVLTINSPVVASGGSNLLVDFSDASADRLVINGAASGATTVNATYVGAGLINIGGVLVVDAASASPNAFVLGTVGGNTSPLVDYSLRKNGGDFLLASTPNASAFAPLAVTSFGRSLWYQSADEVIAQTRLPAETIGASFWGQIYLSRDKMDHDSTQVISGVAFDVDHNLRTKRRGIQLGVDYGFGGGRVGLTGGYARAKADDRGVGNLGLKANGWNIGAYGQFGGRTGFHGELLVKHDRYDVDFNDGLFDGEGTDARANGIDGSVGYRFGMGAATLDANAGISFVRTKFDDIDAFGFSYDLGTVKSTRGRAGLRATFGGTMAPYIDGTVYREFRGDSRVALFDGANFYGLENEGKGTWFRIEGGILPNPTGLMLAAWADLGDKKGLGARLGYRFGGGAIAALPPPPPPPPPPPVEVAPATQTCADGSVILATDMCPAPPPPPPPPAPEPVPERG